MTLITKPAILRAVDALKAGNRIEAAALLREELVAAPSGARLGSLARLAGNIGEMLTEIEALGRAAETPPVTLETVLTYCESLARYGNVREAKGVVDQLPAELQNHVAVLHFLGTLAVQIGDFAAAEAYFSRVLGAAPLSAQTWHILSTIKTFTIADRDIETMERLRPDIASKMPDDFPQFLYALAKAYDDAGLSQLAAVTYDEGASLKAAKAPYDRAASALFVQQVLSGYTPASMSRLTPSSATSSRAMFINGLPRSGTTLVEQILTSHSAVRDGGELNLLASALIPAGNLTFADALAYQEARPQDPWGIVGHDYMNLIGQRFGAQGRVVDKTLNHARLMGLLMHSLPEAKVVWMRRNAEDCALSCYRTFFATSMPWSWSAGDIAHYFQLEDKLYAHWAELFPDRILTVFYEDLVSEPVTWISKILNHTGMEVEPQVFSPEKQQRSVMTASVAQVREPISKSRIGSSTKYEAFISDFQRAYAVGYSA